MKQNILQGITISYWFIFYALGYYAGVLPSLEQITDLQVTPFHYAWLVVYYFVVVFSDALTYEGVEFFTKKKGDVDGKR